MDHSQCFTASLYSLSSSASSSSYLMIKITTDQLPPYNLHGQFSTNQQNESRILGLRNLDNKWMPLLQLISSACSTTTTTLSLPSFCHMRAPSLRANYQSPQSAILRNYHIVQSLIIRAVRNLRLTRGRRNITAYPSPWEPSAWEEPRFINRVHVNHHLEDASLNIPTRRPRLIRQMH